MKIVLKKEEKKGKVITWTKKADFMAIVGTEKSSFNGKVKVEHKVLAEKLIAKGFAKKSSAEFELTENMLRTVKPFAIK